MAVNVLENQSQFRKKDDVKIKIITAECFINMNTGEYLSAMPEDADATEFAKEWAKLRGAVRKDQTGEVFETAHDVQDATYTYTEVYLSKDSYCEMVFSKNTDWYSAIVYQNLYPNYEAAKTYSEGDIVVYSNHEWISDMNDNTGNQPNNGVGWSEYLPYIETREVEWKTLEELANE